MAHPPPPPSKRAAGIPVGDAAPPGAEASERIRAELLTLLSHELRGPLGAITAAADVLEAVPPESETAAEARDIIARQARTLAHLLDDLRFRSHACATDPPSAPALAQGDVLPLSRRRQVLVIGSDAGASSFLRDQLERDGHHVSTTGGGVEGLRQLLALRPQVSIVSLLGAAARDFARQARAAGYAGRLIALPAGAAHGTQQDLLAAGFDACLREPVDRAQLRASLSSD